MGGDGIRTIYTLPGDGSECQPTGESISEVHFLNVVLNIFIGSALMDELETQFHREF